MAAEGDVVPAAVGSDRQVDVAERYGGPHDEGRGMAASSAGRWCGIPAMASGAEVLKQLVAQLPGARATSSTAPSTAPSRASPGPDGREDLEQSMAEVAKQGADLGIAFDGDADRIGVVDDEAASCSAEPAAGGPRRDVLKSRKPAAPSSPT